MKQIFVMSAAVLLFAAVFFVSSCGNDENDGNDEDVANGFSELEVDSGFDWKTSKKHTMELGIVSQDKPVGPAVITISRYDSKTGKAGSRIMKAVIQKDEPLKFDLQLPEIEEKVVIKATYYGKSTEMTVNASELETLKSFEIYTGKRPGTDPEADYDGEVIK